MFFAIILFSYISKISAFLFSLIVFLPGVLACNTTNDSFASNGSPVLENTWTPDSFNTFDKNLKSNCQEP